MSPIAAIPVRELPRFRPALLAWFAAAQRDLDWRRTRDPYGIWISEIMLQQTRVAAVVPYYRQFLAQFPTVQALARARSDTVLRRWAGLGYYSRARNLHRAAKEIVARHNGKFPRAMDAALDLPGIGAYTAAAVLSIAYQRPHAVLDGNVARVLARLGAVRGDLRQPQLWRSLQTAADKLLAAKTPGDWNQAMMELGATVCTPRAPRCGECPVARWCQARKLGLTESLPTVRRKAAPVRITLAACVMLDPRGRTLLVRPTTATNDNDGGSSGAAIFSRLWQFPAVAAKGRATTRSAQRVLAEYLARAFGLHDASLEPLPVARHAVTFREITLAPFLSRVEHLPAVAGARTLPLDTVDRLPISSATRKIAAVALGHLLRARDAK